MTASRPEPGWSLADWLAWLEQGARGEVLLGLERVQRVHARMGLRTRPTLTIAGTNGKGSCAHAAEAIARQLGRSTGLYTSPHILDFGERMRIDGAVAGEAAVVAALARVEGARDDVPLTYFEFTTLAALWLFDEADVDLQILEVGLGGRLDAVNVVDADACVITSIGRDHTRELGSDLRAIAREKAGVARTGRPAVVAQHPLPDGLGEAVSERGGVLHAMPALDGDEVCWSPPGWGLALPAASEQGDALRRNIAAAALALEQLGESRAGIGAALETVVPRFRLAGRMQAHRDMILDVAHNAEAARELVAGLRLRAPHWRIVLGMVADKPVEDVARALAPVASKFICAPLPPPRGMTETDLGRRLQRDGISADSAPSVAAAIAAARAGLPEDAGILVTGSFLTVAAALRA